VDVFKPRGAAKPRNPTSDQQQNGQITNTPRYDRMGGLSNASKTAAKNIYKIVPPGDGKKVI
jgi:hypothetical protein